MSNWRDQEPVNDQDLVAMADGVLDVERADFVEREVKLDRSLEARLELIRKGERPFAEAFDSLLEQAPHDRLEQILKLAKDPPPPPVEVKLVEEEIVEEELFAPSAPVEMPRRSSRSWGGMRLLAAAVVLLAVFAGGLAASRYIQLPGIGPVTPQVIAQKKGWREAVAEYQSLFVKATLEQASLDSAAQAQSLRSALSHIGLDLSVSKVTVPPLGLRRSEVLNFRGKPLVQVAYLFEGETPVSFCIIRSNKPAHTIKSEVRHGLNISHWQNGEYSFMVIGDVPQRELGRIAAELKERLS